MELLNIYDHLNAILDLQHQRQNGVTSPEVTLPLLHLASMYWVGNVSLTVDELGVRIKLDPSKKYTFKDLAKLHPNVSELVLFCCVIEQAILYLTSLPEYLELEEAYKLQVK